MKLKSLFTILVLAILAANFNAVAEVSLKKTFQKREITRDTRAKAPEKSTSAPISDANTGTFTSSSAAAAPQAQSEEWGLFGISPRTDIKDRSIFPSDSCNITPSTLMEDGPCKKACGSKCMKPCGSKCTKPCAPKCQAAQKCPKKCPPKAAPLPAPAPREMVESCITLITDDMYDAIHQCKDLAPVELQWVDFRIKKDKQYSGFSNKLGNYRFRIFGCRRDSKEIFLNQNRAMQRDMEFIDIFDTLVSDCINVVKVPTDLCLDETQQTPEYILTAEITDYFMNVCDAYNWNEAQKDNKRAGSSEITVTWRLMNLTKTNVYWKGTTNGYGELLDGEFNGEVVLAERAFADAVNNLRQQPDFEKQLSIRVKPEELARQKRALAELQMAANPVKCQYQEVIEEAVCGIPAPAVQKTIVEEITIIPELQTTEEIISIPAKQETVVEEVSVIVGEARIGEITEEIVKTEIIETGGIISGGSNQSSSASSQSVSVSTVCVITGEDGITSREVCPIEKVEEVEVKDYWVDINTSESAAFDAKNMLCIIGRQPFDLPAPENILKIRTSVVLVTNGSGEQGAGLIVSERFILTSADLITKANNRYDIETIKGKKMKATAFRINPVKNVALMLLDAPTSYDPLPLNTKLPEVGKDKFITLGLLDFSTRNEEAFLQGQGKIEGYRYSDEMGAEIIVDTFVQNVTIGGTLIDPQGNIVGLAHSGKKLDDGPDLFMPIEGALEAVGLEICGQEYKAPREPYKPISEALATVKQAEPEAMPEKKRK